MESIKDKVAIIGMGCTRFGEWWDKDFDDLVIDAASEAFEDAGVGSKDIQAAWVGTMYNFSGAAISAPLQLQYIPVSRVENACATSAEALRAAVFALIARAYDLVLVVGVEKQKDIGYAGLDPRFTSEKWHPVYGFGISAPARYALAATRYFHQYGLSPEEGKTTLAKISVKSHHNGARNPRAHLRREVTLEQVMNAPIIAWPLGLLDCCGVTDGAAAAILCRAEDAKGFKDSYVTIKACAISVGPGQGRIRTDYDFTHWDETEYAARQAYGMAGINDPRKELDVAEIHDAFSICELIGTESLGFCPKGRAKEDVDAGSFTQEGELPINISGGLKSFGHPIGASGCREVYEIYSQMLHKAQEPSRQLPKVELGLAHNQGGSPGKFMCGITILGMP